MQKGEIVEQGKHADLIAKNGTYARLVALQTLE
jgi:subfamily B ATP-binding cassette protein MsbA